jgi:hypothetical protein
MTVSPQNPTEYDEDSRTPIASLKVVTIRDKCLFVPEM